MKYLPLALLFLVGCLIIVFSVPRKRSSVNHLDTNANSALSLNHAEDNQRARGVERDPAKHEESEKEIGTPVFKCGLLELAMKFEDTSISPVIAHKISNDINGVFSHLDVKFMPFRDGKRLDFEGEGRIRPDALKVVWLVHEEGRKQILSVPKSVTDAYLKAFEFMRNENIDEAKVHQFIDEVKSGSIGHEVFAQIKTSNLSSKALVDLASELRDGEVKVPSVLSYKFLNFGGREELVAETLFLEIQDASVTFAQRIGIIRINDTWRIFL